MRWRVRQQGPRVDSDGYSALLSQKAGKPVMMRITRREEHFIGRARPGIQGRIKIGFRNDGRVTAIDMFLVQTAVRTGGQVTICRRPNTPR